jgi:GNAT superfamily N-acetyltransferase
MTTQALATTRAARPSDAEAIAGLAGELGYPMDAATALQRMGFIERATERALIVAELDGVVVGWIELEVRSVLAGGRNAEIAGLVVASSARRSGAGRALVGVARAWASEHNAPKVRVRSNAKREEAAIFYPAVGFALEKMQRVFTLVP